MLRVSVLCRPCYYPEHLQGCSPSIETSEARPVCDTTVCKWPQPLVHTKVSLWQVRVARPQTLDRSTQPAQGGLQHTSTLGQILLPLEDLRRVAFH